MKLKLFFSFLVAGVAVASAQQGFRDGVEYFRADQPEEAEIILSRTLNDPSTDISTAKYYLGEIALQKNDLATAKKFFEEGIMANAQNGFNYVGLGELALKQGNASEASDFFKQARQYGKKDAVMITDIARAYYNADPVKYAKEIAKNIADAKKANKTCPAIYILEADMLAPTNPGEAAGHYEMAMQYDPEVNHPEAYVKYGRTYFRVSPEFAINGIKKLVELQPNSALAQRELAEKYYEADQLTRAAEQYGKYIQNPNHFKRDEQRYVGLLYFGKKYDESLDLARRILAEDPNNFYMKRMELLDLAALKRYEDAAQAGARFMASKGEFVPNDYTTYGEVLLELGQDSLAVAQYEAAVAAAPEKPALLSTLSDAYTSAKMYDKAAEAQERYIAADPDHSTNDLMVLARRYMNAAATTPVEDPARAEYVKKGLAIVDEVDSRVPGNYQVLVTRARLNLIGDNNELTEASVPSFVEVLNILDSDPENVTKRKSDYSMVLNALGKYYLGQKDPDNARLYFGKMSDIFPENADLKAFVDKLGK